MVNTKTLSCLLLLLPFALLGQYTEVINSNRPGVSVSAYALGSNVLQFEVGGLYEIQNHDTNNTESNIIGADFALRYGLYFETLELVYEGTYVSQNITFNNFGVEETRNDFRRNRAGLKFLIFDPFKNPENNKPNLYSWRANNKFQFKNLLPAVSLYGGATFNLGNNPFCPEDETISYRGMISTQSRLTPKSTLITNVAYDRITTDFPEWNYVISFQRAFRNPKWSIFLEHQGIVSDRYSDTLFRTGVAHLFSENFQMDLNFGGSIKTTPSRYFGSFGLSYRLDFHQDKLVPINKQRPEGKIKRGAMKKQRPKKKKKKGKVDF